MKKTPLAQVKEKFSAETAKDAKKKLVAELEKFTKSDDLWVNRENRGKGLAHVSNAKLLRLLGIFTEVKSKFGTRAKLIEQIAELDKRSKDEGYKTRLGGYPVPRLYDLWKATQKRVSAASGEKKAAKKPAAAKKAAAPKAAAPAKKPAAKKAAAKK